MAQSCRRFKHNGGALSTNVMHEFNNLHVQGKNLMFGPISQFNMCEKKLDRSQYLALITLVIILHFCVIYLVGKTQIWVPFQTEATAMAF